MKQEELNKVLELHRKWLYGEDGGVRADLRGANLSGADLREADLSGAYLRGANLREANLYGANLLKANLSGVNLCGADLREADLSGAYLRGANLREANLRDCVGLGQQVIAGEGEIIGYKKVYDDRDAFILKLLIPKNAKRVNAIGSRKCRCDMAVVLSAHNLDGSECSQQAFRSGHDANFSYTVGATVAVPDYDPSDRIECAAGIHYFITFSEAEEY
jgi:uncharacterized protein YjbI with pentapeptide repeats